MIQDTSCKLPFIVEKTFLSQHFNFAIFQISHYIIYITQFENSESFFTLYLNFIALFLHENLLKFKSALDIHYLYSKEILNVPSLIFSHEEFSGYACIYHMHGLKKRNYERNYVC